MNEPSLRRVMHVEDDDDIREITRMALEAFGMLDVCSCASGAEALAAIDDYMPDLLLIDVMMPDMDGPAVLEALRRRGAGRDVPAIFVTAKAAEGEHQALKREGVVGIITKPFDPVSLADEVKSLWPNAR